MKGLPDSFAGAPFRPLYVEEFLSRLSHRRYREQRERVIGVVERICRNPFHLSHLLDNKHGLDWRGKRDRHVAGDVIIFAICRECAQSSFLDQGLNQCCSGPAPLDEEAIIFLTLGSHKALFGCG